LKKADVKTEVYAAPPAAKEKLLKKFLFGISSKRFTGRRERIAAALPSPTPHVKSFVNKIQGEIVRVFSAFEL